MVFAVVVLVSVTGFFGEAVPFGELDWAEVFTYWAVGSGMVFLLPMLGAAKRRRQQHHPWSP